MRLRADEARESESVEALGLEVDLLKVRVASAHVVV